MKKFLLIHIMAIFTFCVAPCIHGATQNVILDTPVIDGTTVTVSGRTPTANAELMLIVTKEGKTAKDIKAVYFAKQIISEYDGSFETQLIVSETDRENGQPLLNGIFTIWASSTDSAMVSKNFEYAHPRGRELLLNQINQSNSPEELKQLLTSSSNTIVLKNMGTMLDEFILLPDDLQLIACKLLCDYKDNFDEKSWKEKSDDVISAMLINNTDTKEALLTILENENVKKLSELQFEKVLFEDEGDEKREFFIKLVLMNAKENKFSSIADLNLLYKQAMIIYKLNTTNYLLIYDDILLPYGELLGLSDNSDYKNLKLQTETDRDSVMKQFKAIGKNIEVLEDIADVLKKAISAHNLTKTQSSGGGTRRSSDGETTASKSSVSGARAYGMSKTTVLDNNKEAVTIIFNDIVNVSWAEESIVNLAKAGVLSGDGNGKFRPDSPITRAEFITMIIRALDFTDKDAACSFEDVPENNWAYPYVATAQKIGITSGMSEKLFGADNLITRQEMAVFVHHAAIRAYLPVTDKEGEDFDDENQIADWAIRSVSLMHGAGIIKGKGENNFEPTANATRAEAAKLIYELFRMI